MKKSLVLLFSALCSFSAIAQTLPALNVNASTYTEDNTITLTSPRTGIEYTLANPKKIKYVLQVEEVAPVNEQNAKRIMAKNPALSPESQELARQALLKK